MANQRNTIVIGSEQISIFDNGGNEVILEGVLPNNQTGIQVEDSNGLPVAQMGSLSNGFSGIKLLDTKGIGVAFFGRTPAGSTVLQIADAGIEVTTASEAELILNSQNNMFQILSSGTETLSTSDSSLSNSVSIPHGLSTAPAVIAFVAPPPLTDFLPLNAYPSFGGGYVPLPYTISAVQVVSSTDTTINLEYMSFTVDNTNVNLSMQQTVTGLDASTHEATFYYYILQQTANTTA